jgi:hypothetical protein
VKNSDVWKADADVLHLMQQCIAKWHPTLALVDKNIAVIMRAKAAKAGGQPVLGVARKAPPILGVLGDGEYEFVLEIAADEWQSLTDNQRTALMDHLLCSCKCEEEEGTGEVKCSVVKPDVFFHYEELKRHGDWRPRRQEDEGPAIDVEAKILGEEQVSDSSN